MLRINKKLEYALMSLKYMLGKPEGELTTAREICEKFNAPFDTTAKVLQAMNLHEVLNSVKGVKGGYILAKKFGDISFIQLSQIVEGKNTSIGCTNGNPCSMHSGCIISEHILGIDSVIKEFLSRVSLKDFFENHYDHIQIR